MDTLQIYQKCKKLPFGNRIMAYLVCRRIPYFLSIKPRVDALEVGHVEVSMTERKAIHNHLPSIHAIALCNLCELAMALVTDVTIPKNFRFIPVGMRVEYKAKAKGVVRAFSDMKPEDYQVGRVDVPVHIFDGNNINVMSAVITVDVK